MADQPPVGPVRRPTARTTRRRPDPPAGLPPRSHNRARVPDRIVFDTMLQVLRFGCSYEAIADTTCSATTIRNRRDEWIELGVFAQLKAIVLDAYDRIVGLILGHRQ
jgi:transposase